uniref:Uncharacterized protein n=1 Tax=Vitis vinifera TaxID=29760 RepID=A5B5G9_VITVI|nr:hypothetical protein VITISV_020327 [Vitis vinifera]
MALQDLRTWPSSRVAEKQASWLWWWAAQGGDVAPLTADYASRGIGEDGDAEMPPLVFAMAEMLGSGLIRFRKGGNSACVSLASLLQGFK